MPNSGCPIAILSTYCQLLRLEEVKDHLKGNLLSLFLDFLLQCRIWNPFPTSVIDSFLSTLMGYCPISQYGISKLSFLEAGYTVNHHNYIRFLCTAVIPFICQHHGNSRYYLMMDLASAYYVNEALAFFRQPSICFVSKGANQPCVALLRPVEDFWAALKKAD